MLDALRAAMADFGKYAHANDVLVQDEVDTVVRDALSQFRAFLGPPLML